MPGGSPASHQWPRKPARAYDPGGPAGGSAPAGGDVARPRPHTAPLCRLSEPGAERLLPAPAKRHPGGCRARAPTLPGPRCPGPLRGPVFRAGVWGGAGGKRGVGRRGRLLGKGAEGVVYAGYYDAVPCAGKVHPRAGPGRGPATIEPL